MRTRRTKTKNNPHHNNSLTQDFPNPIIHLSLFRGDTAAWKVSRCLPKAVCELGYKVEDIDSAG